MKINIQKPRQALNKAFLKVKPTRSEIDNFKTNLIHLIDNINKVESEEFHKNLVIEFLKKTYYDSTYFINTKGRNDLVIHNEIIASSTVGVIVETKKPTNSSEMITKENLNKKAFHELVLYYLRERILHKNDEVKHLIITNINEWYIFDSNTFKRLFIDNKSFVKRFKDFEQGRLDGVKTEFFYNDIAEPFIANLETEINFAYFDIREYNKPLRNVCNVDDNKLIALFKLLSPEHLLKLPFTNDSNSLDKSFYNELLHIIGLKEIKQGGKKLIGRLNEGERNRGSILENAVIQMDSLDKLSRIGRSSRHGDNFQERIFNVALELTITWLNRILFLKLLEAQLIAYHKGDSSYAFLNTDKIKGYDDLNTLFFRVLARKHEDRHSEINQIFGNVPYLNSSLFEPTELEHDTLFISNLKYDKTIPILSSTVLKDNNGKSKTGKLNTLQYLFQFLDAYDFSSEGSEDIQEENKTLINASVLGLFFEKINGYKDGSFFTPGFITMYMCHETIRKAIVQKFNEVKDWDCKNLGEVYDKIEDRKEANEIVNSIKICDPAVGSGHFLVSALNELIAIKSELRILQDRDGRRLKEYFVKVENDELIVNDEDGELFEYNPNNKESQRIQEALFHEKQTIIENCLFGVDINYNSVKICRLRLWIELLKNSYYKNKKELETLPNIDINIKCGNSLVSRFDLDSDLKHALIKSKWNINSYKLAVSTYKNAENKEQKREMEQLINDIKSDFRSHISYKDPKVTKLHRLSNTLNQMTQKQLFDMSAKDQKAWNQKVQELTKHTNKLEAEIEEIKSNKIYENAFEWRFEFPEVLNDDGKFVGFDVVIGNPPYIRQEEVKFLSSYFQTKFQSFSGKSDIYVFFYENSINLLKPNGVINFITSGKFFEANYGKPLIEFLLNNTEIIEIINFNDLPVFEGATAYPLIYFAAKVIKEDYIFKYYNLNELPTFLLKEKLSNAVLLNTSKSIFIQNDFKFIDNKISKIIEKVKIGTIPIKDFCGLPIVGVKTGFNEGFLTDLENDKIVKPYVFGRDIKRYNPITPTNKIIFPYTDDYSIVDLKVHAEISSCLEKQKTKLSQRAIIKEGLINKTKYWYEYQQINKTVNYNIEYITYPNVSLGNNFTLTKGAIIDMTGFLIKSNSRYLLAILNSKLIAFLMNIWSIRRRGGYLEYKVQYIEKIPIKNISEKQQKPFIELVERILAGRKTNYQTTDLENQIDQLVYQLYDLTEEEIEIIESI